jgi:glutamate formiminotransferase/formiminotetrahydrofolate cyclodeaminase
VAALAGSLAAALGAMVSTLTYEKKGMEERRDVMAQLGLEAQELHGRLMAAVDEDTRAFERVMAAARLPRRTDAERAVREAAMQSATAGAIDVPLSVMRDAARAQEIAAVLAEQGMESARSDAGVAALMAFAAVEGAWYNVAINLPGLTDKALAAARIQEAERLLARAQETAEAARAAMRSAMRSALHPA